MVNRSNVLANDGQKRCARVIVVDTFFTLNFVNVPDSLPQQKEAFSSAKQFLNKDPFGEAAQRACVLQVTPVSWRCRRCPPNS